MQPLFELNYTKLAETPFEVVLEHPETGEKLEDKKTGDKMFFLVYGMDSEVYQNARKRELFTKLAKEQDKGEGKLTVEEMLANFESNEEMTLETIAACTAGGKLLGVDPEKPDEWVDVTKENALDMLKLIKWIPIQINTAILDRSNIVAKHKKK